MLSYGTKVFGLAAYCEREGVFIKHYYGNQIKRNEILDASTMHGKRKICVHNISGEITREVVT
jgi:hypothetical protein